MNPLSDHRQFNRITYACYTKRVREGEQFIPDHVFSYQISGTLFMNDGNKEYVFKENTFRLTKRNSLLKFVKQPGAQGEFKSLSVFLDQQTLKSLSIEYGYRAQKQPHSAPVMLLKSHKMLINYNESLKPYDELVKEENSVLRSLKMKELIVLLIETNPDLMNVLFDFTEPGKIDMEAFMIKNFRFNVSLDRFAYLTGRSLSTFKRDFEKIFSSHPGKWLQQKRLEEAYYLILKKGVLPSQVYIDVGFEDLSHFSYAFKKKYGAAPTKIRVKS